MADGSVTIGDIKISRLLDRIAMMERRHAEELMDQETQFLIQLNEMQKQLDDLKSKKERPTRKQVAGNGEA